VIKNAYPIEIISDLNDFANDEAWWAIYRQAFPANELEPKEVLLKGLKTGATLSLRVRDAITRTTIGIAHGQFLHGFKAFMLIYIAIAKDYRGRGIGRYFFKDIEHKIDSAPQALHRGLVFEVDSPDHSISETETILAWQRIRFYQTLGYHLQNIHYYQPALSPNQQSVPMYLMGPQPSLSKAQQQALVKSIYFEKYSTEGGVSQVDSEYIASLWLKITQQNEWL
jgi:GNAT superfamily N-acetyltransferase